MGARLLVLAVLIPAAGLCWVLFGPPWSSWSTVSDYGLSLLPILLLLLLFEAVYVRSIDISDAGVRFHYLFRATTVPWDRLSVNKGQPAAWENMMAIRETRPTSEEHRIRQVTREQGEAIRAGVQERGSRLAAAK